MPAPAFGDAFRLTLLTDDPGQAAAADAAGVDLVGVDLERLGKAERQQGLDTRLSVHSLQDLARLRPAVSRAQLFARLNPLHSATGAEVEEALSIGAQALMLPFFHTAREAEGFVRLVDGRARAMVLVETAAAVSGLRDILAVGGIDEVMVGLNDLRLELKASHHLELLAAPVMEGIAAEVSGAGLPLSIGGVASPDDIGLPVAADLVLAQYPRLGATGAWLSRSFLGGLPQDPSALAAAVRGLRRRLTDWSLAGHDELEQARRELADAVRRLAGGALG